MTESENESYWTLRDVVFLILLGPTLPFLEGYVKIREQVASIEPREEVRETLRRSVYWGVLLVRRLGSYFDR